MKKVALGVFVAFLLGCNEFIPELTVYKPDEVYPGHTMVFVSSYRNFMLFDFNGSTSWSHEDLTISIHSDFEVLDNGDFLFITANGSPSILRYPDEILYVGPYVNAHHSILMLPWGNILVIQYQSIYVGGTLGKVGTSNILEIDPNTDEIIWEWKFHEHVDPHEHHDPILLPDWTHGNTLHFYEDQSTILFNPRNLDTVYMISYPDGEILWACGDHGTFGQDLFDSPHDPYILPNGNMLMFDNGLYREPHFSRALELAVDPQTQSAEIAWEYRESPDFYSYVMGDANRLPNGNTLITDATNGRLVEVNAQGEKVWQLRILMGEDLSFASHQIYKAERLPYGFWDICVEADGDGYSPESPNCGPVDCDDDDPTVHPGAAELCDGLDNNCDSNVPPEENDVDGDGYRICQGDCDDDEPTVYPGATELCDGLDNDCDSTVPPEETDADGDGYRICQGDCDDEEPTVYPGASELCDGLDNDCDSTIPPEEIDADGDGYRICQGDCDDGEPTVYPGAPEICDDGLDNDCDTLTDGEDPDCSGG